MSTKAKTLTTQTEARPLLRASAQSPEPPNLQLAYRTERQPTGHQSRGQSHCTTLDINRLQVCLAFMKTVNDNPCFQSMIHFTKGSKESL